MKTDYGISIYFLMAMMFAFAVSAQSASRVDLRVENIQLQPSRITTQTAVVVSPSIRNSGSQAAEGFFIALTIKRSGRIVRRIPDVPVLSNLPRMGSGLSVPIEIGLLEEGEYTVEIEIDPKNTLDDQNKANNKAKKMFRVWQPSYNSVTYGY